MKTADLDKVSPEPADFFSLAETLQGFFLAFEQATQRSSLVDQGQDTGEV